MNDVEGPMGEQATRAAQEGRWWERPFEAQAAWTCGVGLPA